MRRVDFLFAAFVMAVAVPCMGQYTACPGSGTIIEVTPSTPDTSESIQITGGVEEWVPNGGQVGGSSARVDGNKINISFIAAFFANSSRRCLTLTVPPLAAGSYEIDVYLLNGSFRLPQFVGIAGTTTLTVVPVQASPVPTTPAAILATLAIVLSALALRQRLL
jgi:hypothetical protein